MSEHLSALGGAVRAALTALLAAVLTALAAAPAAAADAPCDIVPPLAALSGAYDVTIGSGLLFGDNRIVPVRPQNRFVANMQAQGDLLMMEADGSVVVLEYADPADRALDFKELEDVINVAPHDIPSLLGCGLDRLPILVGGGLANAQEGTPIEFEYELLIFSYRAGALPSMMGTVSWSGGGIISVRSVMVSPRR